MELDPHDAPTQAFQAVVQALDDLDPEVLASATDHFVSVVTANASDKHDPAEIESALRTLVAVMTRASAASDGTPLTLECIDATLGDTHGLTRHVVDRVATNVGIGHLVAETFTPEQAPRITDAMNRTVPGLLDAWEARGRDLEALIQHCADDHPDYAREILSTVAVVANQAAQEATQAANDWLETGMTVASHALDYDYDSETLGALWGLIEVSGIQIDIVYTVSETLGGWQARALRGQAARAPLNWHDLTRDIATRLTEKGYPTPKSTARALADFITLTLPMQAPDTNTFEFIAARTAELLQDPDTAARATLLAVMLFARITREYDFEGTPVASA